MTLYENMEHAYSFVPVFVSVPMSCVCLAAGATLDFDLFHGNRPLLLFDKVDVN